MEEQDSISSFASEESPTGSATKSTSEGVQRLGQETKEGLDDGVGSRAPQAEVPLNDTSSPRLDASNPNLEGSGHGMDRSGHSIGRLGGSYRRRRSSANTPGAARGGPKISWKSDPKVTFSDWRVEVGHQESGIVDVYHLHRNMVGFGPRKSVFLLDEFNHQMEDPKSGYTTRFDLPDTLAQAFPMVLDFMYYTKEVKQRLTAERACRVFKLAEMLYIRPLQGAIADFYRKNLSLKNMGEFLTAASLAKAEGLIFVSKTKIGSLIAEKPELAGLIPPKFLSDVLDINRKQLDQQRAKDPEDYSVEIEHAQSRLWSKAAFVCVNHNESVMTKKLFEQLTKEESLPAIDASVALRLLAMDSKFNSTASEYSNLQKRCVSSITDDWEAFQKGFASSDAVSVALQQLPSHILADILMKSMTRNQG